MGVCKSPIPDDFTSEYWLFSPRWICDLSNGETVFQDDDRPGEEPKSAWLRLRQYCQENNLSITHMRLEFRSNTQRSLPDDAEGYFFCKGCGAFLFGGGTTLGFYLVGYLKGDKVIVHQYKSPEMILVSTEERLAADCEACLIRSAPKPSGA